MRLAQLFTKHIFRKGYIKINFDAHYFVSIKKYGVSQSRYQMCQNLNLGVPVKWRKNTVPKFVHRGRFKSLYKLSIKSYGPRIIALTDICGITSLVEQRLHAPCAHMCEATGVVYIYFFFVFNTCFHLALLLSRGPTGRWPGDRSSSWRL